MSQTAATVFEPHITPRPRYPRGFRPRRGLNWGFLGLLYTSFYMCRYNLPLANKAISDQYGYSHEQMGQIITAWMIAYAVGQIVNGLITDRIGGKRAMLIGAVGTIVMNIAFGAASFIGLLWVFTVIRGIDGYVQSFGAPGMTKIKTAWFPKIERGGFAGIFGFMINLGRFGIFKLGPALLAGFTILWMIRIPPLHWRWLFWVPSMICALVAVGMAFTVKETPEEAGYPGLIPLEADETGQGSTETRARFSEVFDRIIKNPAVWIVAAAYSCTGAVRQAVDQWFPRYMQDNFHTDLNSAQFQFLAFLIPLVASAGSLASGYISDLMFKGQRSPVAAALYLIEAGIILLATQFHSANSAVVFFVLISFTANSTHSILGTAAAMDIGGRKMTGFASGLIDSFQYFGGSLSGFLLSWLLDKSWNYYFYFMVPFGLIGCILMVLGGKTIARGSNR
ncbi:MAG TPA: MFS transporter [Verrucomicrobiae bacterium]|nr:MFS transporter [Verrucomicrobiae bacterium]